MNILITGAKGMVGTALVNNLKNIRDGKNRTRPNIHIDNIYCYDIDSTPEQLDAYCADCDFVFNLAGVNRPQNSAEFMQGNFGFASTLLDTLSVSEDEQTINRLLIRQLLTQFSPRERQVIMLRYFGDKTQSQIAALIGVSQVQVSRILKSSLQKLRDAM